MSTIGNPYSPLRLDEALLENKASVASTVLHDELQSLPVANQYKARTNIGAGFGFENRLINPLHQVDIEGNAGGVTASGKHVVEGWRTIFSNAVTTQTTSRVAGDRVPYALRYAVTTGSDTSIAAGDYAGIDTVIEGYDLADAKWGTADAKSIWVCGRIKAPTTGTYCVAVQDTPNTLSYVFEVPCTANTWVDFEKEIPGDTSGTWDKTNGKGLYLAFAIAFGSNFHATADTWSAGSLYATANQANGLATNGNIYEIENIRVSVGKPIKTEWRPYPLDLIQCQRYFQRIKLLVAVSAGQFDNPSWTLPVTMRAAASITTSYYSGGTGALFSSSETVLYQYAPHSVDTAFDVNLNARMI